ncbi:hypothetical protein IJI17_00250 [Candidatus Saccharibacteria bacterium]|nr:hypothetical protein [Candidatus Saccharibacteria bacterium]
MKAHVKAISVLFIALFIFSITSLCAYADDGLDVVVEGPVEPEEYSRTGVSFYSDHDVTIYTGNGSSVYITVHNTGFSSFSLCVKMYDYDNSGSSLIWSDLNEGGLAPGGWRTYYVGSNIDKVCVRGILGYGEFDYSY